MGKGFNNYMCKKFFHPASRDNLKRVWMAEQKTEAYKKKQEELRVQYEKEQDLYNNKALLWKDSKEKLSLNFMYDPPPGLVKDKQGEDEPIELESKFEWQRKFNAPREDYCKGDSAIRDQPFGIRVRNVRCIRCHNMGHLNTDRECPLFHKSVEGEISGGMDTSFLLKQMQDDGLTIKPSLLRPEARLCKVDYNLDERYKEYSEELEFVRKLPREDKIMLLKALRKIRKKEKKEEKSKIEKIAKRLKKEAERKYKEEEIDREKGKKEERKKENRRKDDYESEKEGKRKKDHEKEREKGNERKRRKEHEKEKVNNSKRSEYEKEKENEYKRRKEYEKEEETENERKKRKEHEKEKERKRRREHEKEMESKSKRRREYEQEKEDEKSRDRNRERKRKY